MAKRGKANSEARENAATWLRGPVGERGRSFEDAVAGVLKESGFKFLRDPAYAGLQPDFAVELPGNMTMNDNTIGYSKGQTHRLRGHLEKRLTALLK